LSLDLRTLRWRAVQGPRPREHLAATALGGRVFALGGRIGASYDTSVATVEAYDPRTSRWTRLPDLPDPRGGTGAASIGGMLVSAGGESSTGTFETVWALRPGGRWRRLPDLPTPRHGVGVVALRGRVWVVAGGPEPGLTVSGAVESLAVP